MFVRSGGAWSRQAHLTGSDAAVGDQFGYSVAVSGSTAVVGASRDDTAGGVDAGSAYVFHLAAAPEPTLMPAITSINPAGGPIAGGKAVTITG